MNSQCKMMPFFLYPAYPITLYCHANIFDSSFLSMQPSPSVSNIEKKNLILSFVVLFVNTDNPIQYSRRSIVPSLFVSKNSKSFFLAFASSTEPMDVSSNLGNSASVMVSWNPDSENFFLNFFKILETKCQRLQ